MVGGVCVCAETISQLYYIFRNYIPAVFLRGSCHDRKERVNNNRYASFNAGVLSSEKYRLLGKSRINACITNWCMG